VDSYRETARGLVQAPASSSREEDVMRGYRKLYPLMLEDFAHKKDIEIYVREELQKLAATMAAADPVMGLAVSQLLNARSTGIRETFGNSLVIKKGRRLSAGRVAETDMKDDSVARLGTLIP